MYKHSYVASEIKEKLKEILAHVHDDETVQILHKNNPVRVIVTQMHYFDLVQKAELCERMLEAGDGDIPVRLNGANQKITAENAMQIFKERTAANRARLDAEPDDI